LSSQRESHGRQQKRVRLSLRAGSTGQVNHMILQIDRVSRQTERHQPRNVWRAHRPERRKREWWTEHSRRDYPRGSTGSAPRSSNYHGLVVVVWEKRICLLILTSLLKRFGVSLGLAERNKTSPPMTEEQLRQSTVGELKPFDSTITLVEYNPAWPEHFAREAKRIQAALGNRALSVEHVGSTSVPGLMAKPIIDILLVVADSADEPSYAPALEASGYVLRIREPDWHQHRLFKGPDININLHVFTQGSEEIHRTLMLRDWLRTNKADRELYARTKRDLASKKWKYVQNYADAKSEIVEAILERAAASER
jgi:GrpB-like predicted nucleotidyltransferase (UPF0157 family)